MKGSLLGNSGGVGIGMSEMCWATEAVHCDMGGMHREKGVHWGLECTSVEGDTGTLGALGTCWRPSLGKVGTLRFGMYLGMGGRWEWRHFGMKGVGTGKGGGHRDVGGTGTWHILEYVVALGHEEGVY